jgi:hypothetical protein
MSASTRGRALQDIAQRPRVRTTGRIVYLLVAASLAGGGYLLLRQTLNHPSIACPSSSTALPDYRMVAWGFGALFLGRGLGYLRYNPAWKTLDPHARTWSRSVGMLAFALFLLATTIALVYEAIGEQQFHFSRVPTVPALAPITEYARCAIYYDKRGWSHGAITYAVITVVCALIGHWLWSYHSSRELDLTIDDSGT